MPDTSELEYIFSIIFVMEAVTSLLVVSESNYYMDKLSVTIVPISAEQHPL
jgi:hypothetical protein